MPESSQPVTEAPPTHDRIDHGTTARRLALGAIFVFSVLAIPQLSNPEPAAAGSTCTGWTSQFTPPRTIRVLRTSTGRIQTVDFRKYVARVMASGEWPGRLSMPTLEAGALATKQYAWYYAMKGHHRDYYVRGSTCYDVRDDTDDQLYRPESARPTKRQWAAIDKTWDLTLHKNGRFFLTGYRAGIASTCAADANGWKLYERSIESCAQEGWSSRRILDTYLSPNLTFVWSDRMGPLVSKPRMMLAAGNTVAGGAATVHWQPTHARKTVARFKLQRKVGAGKWHDVRLPRTRAWRTDARLMVGYKNRFRIRAQDRKGNWGAWSYSSRRKPVVRGPVGKTLASDARTGDVRAGSVRTGSVRGARSGPVKIRTRFTGRSVALVARTGAGMGRVKVLVDGKQVATVNLARPAAMRRRLVWAKNWTRSGTHSVAIRPVGSDRPVEFNGFLTLR